MDLNLKSLSIHIKKNDLCLLHPITAHIPGGSICAILGGSGSGKTTLLSVIGNRHDSKGLKVNGNIEFVDANTKHQISYDVNSPVNHQKAENIGFVCQQDYLIPFLTARETLLYVAQLRFPEISCADRTIRYDACLKQVDGIIEVLGLKECADGVYVGSSGVTGGTNGHSKGLSGGEKRRVSVGIQMLSNPRVLCADEPTSGLDSFTALTVMHALRDLTKANPGLANDSSSLATKRPITVICSIHQPRADIFNIFNSVLILSSGGRLVYCGNHGISQMLDYFSSIGYPCPTTSNPADYYVDLSCIDMRGSSSARVGDEKFHQYVDSTEIEDRKRIRKLVKLAENMMQKSHSQFLGTETSQEVSISKVETGLGVESTVTEESKDGLLEQNNANTPYFMGFMSLCNEIYILLYRNMTNNMRDKGNVMGCLIQALLSAIITVGIFYQIPSDTLAGIQSRPGVIYTLLAGENYMLGIILVNRYTTDFIIFDREIQDNLYSTIGFLISYLLSIYPFLFLQSIACGIIVHYGCGLREGLEHLLILCGVLILGTFFISGVALFSASISRHFSIASLVCNSIYTFVCLTGGFLINYASLPVYVGWLKYISYFNYAFQILMNSEFNNRVFDGCPYPTTESCGLYDGNTILDSYKISTSSTSPPMLWVNFFILGCAYHIAAYFVLSNVFFAPVGSVDEGNEIVSDDIEEAGVNDSTDMNFADPQTDLKITIPNIAEPSPVYTMLSPSHNVHQKVRINVQHLSIIVNKPAERTAAVSDIRCTSDATVDTSEGVEMISPKSLNCHADNEVSYCPVPYENDRDGTDHKCILKNVTCSLMPGKLTALMGASGSGKTTLLNAIAGRINKLNSTNVVPDTTNKSVFSFESSVPAYTMRGSVIYTRLEGVEPPDAGNGQENNGLLGYVQQFDYHLPNLTVYETLLFNANMKLPDLNATQRSDRVYKVIQLLGLVSCAHSMVGACGSDSTGPAAGISGGEKRRLSVGIQMLLEPPVCLLDEPTTGLDTFSARHIIESLHEIAIARQRTIIISIHQPRYDIFQYFDDIILLAKGCLIWAGDRTEMLKHLESVGYVCPHLVNPADFILDLTSIDFRSVALEEESKKRLKLLIDAYVAHEKAQSLADFEDLETKNNHAIIEHAHEKRRHSVVYALPLLLERAGVNLWRNVEAMVGRTSQGIFLGLIITLFYTPIGDDQIAIQNLVGCIFFVSSICFIGVLNNIAMFPTERNVFYREYMDESVVGGYSVLSFFLSYMLLSVPFILFAGVGVGILLCVVVGINPTMNGVVLLSYVTCMELLIGECIGITFCALFFHVGFSVNIMSGFLSCLCLASGLVSINMSAVVEFLNYASPYKYACWIAMNVAFKNKEFDCDAVDGTCVTGYSNGNQVLQLYNMADNDVGGMKAHLNIFSGICLLFVIVSYLVLNYRAQSLQKM